MTCKKTKKHSTKGKIISQSKFGSFCNLAGGFHHQNIITKYPIGIQPEKFMPRLEARFAKQDYQIMGDTELYFHNVTSLVFKMLGFYTDVERHTTDERMDMLVQTKDYEDWKVFP